VGYGTRKFLTHKKEVRDRQILKVSGKRGRVSAMSVCLDDRFERKVNHHGLRSETNCMIALWGGDLEKG
jgi:hypothetical protein